MFQIRNLGVLQFSQGFTMWAYKSGPDTIAQTATPGYFQDATDMFADGDVIVVITSRGTGMRVVGRDGERVVTNTLIS